MATLADNVYEEITKLCSKGDLEAENGEYSKAITYYRQALEKVPDPKTDWEASAWIYAALGDACWFMGDYETAKDYFYDAYNCSDGANPFILLRLGQALAECDANEKAREFLLRAYVLMPEVFEGEDDKHYNIIKDLIENGAESKKGFFGRLFEKK